MKIFSIVLIRKQPKENDEQHNYNKLRSNRRSKIIKSYGNLKTEYPNLLHGCDFICFNMMNY